MLNDKEFSLLREALDAARAAEQKEKTKRVPRQDEQANLDSYLRFLTKVQSAILSYNVNK